MKYCLWVQNLSFPIPLLWMYYIKYRIVPSRDETLWEGRFHPWLGMSLMPLNHLLHGMEPRHWVNIDLPETALPARINQQNFADNAFWCNGCLVWNGTFYISCVYRNIVNRKLVITLTFNTVKLPFRQYDSNINLLVLYSPLIHMMAFGH